nr:NlpC/P60 family protein [Anaeromonas frigoriresistens]
MRNNDVMVLQQHLEDLGHFNYHMTTTYFGNVTLNAVKDFQRANGLVVDGYFGPNSYKALMNKVSGSPRKEPANRSSEPKPAPAPKTTNSSASSLSYTRLLKRGVTGQDVQNLQQALKQLGHFDFYKTTTYFGSITTDSVMSFQRSQGIQVDGLAGPNTIRTINNALGNTNSAPSTPAPKENTSSESNGRENITNNIINAAKSYVGVPYRYGGTSSSGFDCSGFTQVVYDKYGINIPRSSSAQASVGTKISKSDLQPGDLVIFSGTYKAGPSHTGIYLGNNEFISATSSKGVAIVSLSNSYWNSHYSYGRRVY